MDGWTFVLWVCAIVGGSTIGAYLVTLVAANMKTILRHFPKITVQVVKEVRPPDGQRIDSGDAIVSVRVRKELPSELD